MKKDDLKKIDFYLVTDSGLSRKGTLNDVAQAVKAGCRIIQVNPAMEKKINGASFANVSRSLIFPAALTPIMFVAARNATNNSLTRT